MQLTNPDDELAIARIAEMAPFFAILAEAEDADAGELERAMRAKAQLEALGEIKAHMDAYANERSSRH